MARAVGLRLALAAMLASCAPHVVRLECETCVVERGTATHCWSDVADQLALADQIERNRHIAEAYRREAVGR